MNQEAAEALDVLAQVVGNVANAIAPRGVRLGAEPCVASNGMHVASLTEAAVACADGLHEIGLALNKLADAGLALAEAVKADDIGWAIRDAASAIREGGAADRPMPSGKAGP
jgi:hypothetical protein